MDGDIHGAVQEAQGSQDGASVQDAQTETVKTAAGGNGGAAANGGGKDAAADYESAIKERDEQIAKLQAQIVDAAKNAEAAEKLAAQIDELRESAESERVEFELRLAGCRNVKAARAVLDDYDGDVDACKAAEPWLFDDGKPAVKSGKTGLEPAGAAKDDEATLKRWRKLAGLDAGE